MKPHHLIFLLLIHSQIALSQEKPADTIIIHFDFNKSIVTPQAATRLDSLLQVAPPIRIKQVSLYGHCDFIGSDKYNDSLSLQRVQATRTYLANKGVDIARFTQIVPFGKRKPLDIATTDDARTINRRVEIVLIKQPVIQTQPKEEMPVVDTPARRSALADMIKDSSVKAGSKLVIPNLNFVGGQHILLQQSYPVLHDLLKIMQDNPNLEIEIQGHICCMMNGDDGLDYNMNTNDLSVQRAKAIYNYLVDQGIARSRMSYKGFGSSQKLFPQELTPMEEAKNRRVEIRIVRK